MSKLDELMALAAQYAYERDDGTTETARDAWVALESALKAVLEDAERWNWLASDMDGNAQGDFIQVLNKAILYPKSAMDSAIDAARKA